MVLERQHAGVAQWFAPARWGCLPHIVTCLRPTRFLRALRSFHRWSLPLKEGTRTIQLGASSPIGLQVTGNKRIAV